MILRASVGPIGTVLWAIRAEGRRINTTQRYGPLHLLGQALSNNRIGNSTKYATKGGNFGHTICIPVSIPKTTMHPIIASIGQSIRWCILLLCTLFLQRLDPCYISNTFNIHVLNVICYQLEVESNTISL